MNKNDDMLSQEEIDALLNDSNEQEEDHSESNNSNTDEKNESSLDVSEYLTDVEIDAIGELGNISFGSSATALSSLLNQKVEITTPTVSVISESALGENFPSPHVAVAVDYTDGFEGSNLFVIRSADAAIIADLMLGGDGTSPNDELGEIQLSAVQEAMNQMMGSAATSMSSVFNKKVDISPPKISLLDVASGEGVDYVPNEQVFTKVSFQLQVGTLIDSNIMQLLPVDFTKAFVNELINSNNEEPAAEEEQIQPKETEAPQQASEPSKKEPTRTETSASNRTENASPQQLGNSHFQKSEAENVENAQFAEFEQPSNLQAHEKRNLDLLMDIPLNVSVELGRSKRSIKDILDLSTGSIVELDKLAGEPVDILVNNKLIAKGEVVVIDENFGVRVSDILSQSERLKKLR
ncbi:flagellar motor switch phosphatase FliY [Halalkalibacillus halophilus]|uniref:flagellar motor switch phosphatase FliY n=1 Tax=Halalkalibacillus halophilus TaxID=392827 RepID=UPI000415BCD1|nr:flagellar motor switch phosphatase FliY [Halalkalibacillus halophilus]